MAHRLPTRIFASAARGGLLPVVAAAILIQLFGSALLPSGSVRAQTPPPLSSGCTSLNAAMYDGFYSGSFGGQGTFNAGERISFSVNSPQSGTPTQIRFDRDFVTVLTASYPGTLVYQVPANAMFFVGWTLDNGQATWQVSCGLTGDQTTPTPTSTPTNTPEPTATFTSTPEPTSTFTSTPEPTATPTFTSTPDPSATPTPCVGQGEDHTDNASDRAQDRRCREKDDSTAAEATLEPKPTKAPQGKGKNK